MDESQEREARELADKLQHELEILTACQTKSKVSGDQQRGRERRELEERVEVSSIHSCLLRGSRLSQWDKKFTTFKYSQSVQNEHD